MCRQCFEDPPRHRGYLRLLAPNTDRTWQKCRITAPCRLDGQICPGAMSNVGWKPRPGLLGQPQLPSTAAEARDEAALRPRFQRRGDVRSRRMPYAIVDPELRNPRSAVNLWVPQSVSFTGRYRIRPTHARRCIEVQIPVNLATRITVA